MHLWETVFLFDIFDRIEDYPPTLVYDALPEVVEDFVNGLSLMIEEEETWQAIQNVNRSFNESQKVEMETMAKEEIFEEKQDLLSDELESRIQKTRKAEEEAFNFEQFIDLEFNDKIQNKMIQEYDKVEYSPSEKNLYFLQRKTVFIIYLETSTQV